MDKKKNHIDDHPLNPQETKTNLYKRPHLPPQHMFTKKRPQEKNKLTDTQPKTTPTPQQQTLVKQTSP